MPVLKFDGKEKGNEYNLAIDTDEYPYPASLYIWTMDDDSDQFDKRASDLIGEDVVAIKWGGGNGHEGGYFIHRIEFERDYCTHRNLKSEGCYGCTREALEAKTTPEDLLLCPFCGDFSKKNVEIIEDTNVYDFEFSGKKPDKWYRGHCKLCDACGPKYNRTKGGAILDWNRRRPKITNG